MHLMHFENESYRPMRFKWNSLANINEGMFEKPKGAELCETNACQAVMHCGESIRLWSCVVVSSAGTI